MRKKIIAGNWKMNKTLSEAENLASEIANKLAANKVEVVLCPPYIALERVAKALKGSGIGLGAQDMHWEESGAYTGKISAQMLLDVGVQYVILGHSEQRAYFYETDESVNQKVKKALASGLTPLICVGETLPERKSGKAIEIVSTQLTGSLKDLNAQEIEKIILAYEPVWAIGTGINATEAEAQEMHKSIRQQITAQFGETVASSLRIQYGGSMKPDNSGKLLAQPDVDGGLVGGASLKAADFIGIIDSV